MVNNHDPALRINSDATGVGQTLLIAGVIGKGEVPLPNHVRIRSELVAAPLREHGFSVEFRDISTVGSEN